MHDGSFEAHNYHCNIYQFSHKETKYLTQRDAELVFFQFEWRDLFSCHQVALKNEYQSCCARPLFIFTYWSLS